MNSNRRTFGARASLAVGSMLMVGVLAACTTPAEPTGPVDLTVTVWTANEDHLALFEEIADAYVAEHGDAVSSVTFEPIPFDSYTSTLTTRVAGNDSPDLAWVLESSAPEFLESGALAPLTETLEATEGYDFDDLSPSALALWSADSELYAYPFSTAPQITLVNNDLFTKAGLPTPREMYDAGNWNWQSVAEASATITAKTGAPGYQVYPVSWQYLSIVWNSFGAQPWSDDYTTCEFDSPEMIEAFEYVHKSVYATDSFPEPGSNYDFFTGQIALLTTGISQAAKLDGSFEWDALPLPAGPDGQANIIGQAGIGALSSGKNVTQATEFLAYFTNPENAAKLSQFFPAPRTSLVTAEKLADVNTTLSEEQLQQIVVDTVGDAKTFPAHPNFAAISNALTPKLDAFWSADADVPSVLAGVCSAIDPLLER